MTLCSDHARGRTPRYKGTAPPKSNCDECWKIYEGEAASSTSITDLKDFRKLSDQRKQELLLGADGFRIVMYDLECTHLKPNVGRILCASFKPLGEPVKTYHAHERAFKQPDVWDDGRLAVAIRQELEAADIIVGWNSKNFDTKFLNSRCLRAGSRTKVAQYQIDGMWSWRSKFNAWSGLDNAQKFADPEAETVKTSVAWAQWMRALGWDKELREQAMAEITDHCERDVIVLEEVYTKLVKAGVIRSLRKDGGIL